MKKMIRFLRLAYAYRAAGRNIKLTISKCCNTITLYVLVLPAPAAARRAEQVYDVAWARSPPHSVSIQFERHSLISSSVAVVVVRLQLQSIEALLWYWQER